MSVMFNLNSHSLTLRRSLLYLTHHHVSLSSFSTLKPKCYHLLLQYQNPSQPSPFSLTLKFFSTASDRQSFTVSYLTTNLGFSPETALKISKRIRFDTPHKPDSVLAFFSNHGFSNSQTHSIFRRAPELLTCDPIKRVLPKFQFLASKGASPSDIVVMVSRSPDFLLKSLDNHIIPAFELVRRFTPSDQRAIACVIACPTSISDSRVRLNVKLLLDYGVTRSNFHQLFRTRPSILCSADLWKVVDEVKQLGFDPSKTSFSVALLAKKTVTKSSWDAKVDALKTWGWSEHEILDAFKRLPHFMLCSKDKLNAVMSFWVGQLGWDPSVLRRAPIIFGYSLEKRLIPRASVIKDLLSKGLISKDASLVTPFSFSEQLFLQKFVNCFEKETSRLLELYHRGK